MEGHIDKVFGFPTLVRFSWNTTDKLMEKHCADVNFYEPDPGDRSYQRWKKDGLKKKLEDPESDDDDFLGGAAAKRVRVREHPAEAVIKGEPPRKKVFTSRGLNLVTSML